MKFASVRVVTPDIERLVEFYQRLSGIEAVRLADGFAEIRFEVSASARPFSTPMESAGNLVPTKYGGDQSGQVIEGTRRRQRV